MIDTFTPGDGSPRDHAYQAQQDKPPRIFPQVDDHEAETLGRFILSLEDV